MGKRLYIGNLPFTVDEAGLTSVFAEFGFKADRTTIVRDRETGVSKGFGFVDLADETAARSAIETMDRAQVEGRPMRIDFANERQPGGGSGGGGSGGGSWSGSKR